MFESIMKLFKKNNKTDKMTSANSKDAAKERLHLVLMQDRANMSADFLELMKQEIIEVIKKYIDVDESAIDVRLTNKENEDGTNGAPALYANIPIINIKNEARKVDSKDQKAEDKTAKKEEDKVEEKIEEPKKKEKKQENNRLDKIEEKIEQEKEKNNKEEIKEVEEVEKEDKTEEKEEDKKENKADDKKNSKNEKEEDKEKNKTEEKTV